MTIVSGTSLSRPLAERVKRLKPMIRFASTLLPLKPCPPPL